jgi:hypothetical protein
LVLPAVVEADPGHTVKVIQAVDAAGPGEVLRRDLCSSAASLVLSLASYVA